MRNYRSHQPRQPGSCLEVATVGDARRTFPASCSVWGLVAGLAACAAPPPPAAPVPAPVVWQKFPASCSMLGLVVGLTACVTPPPPAPVPPPVPVSYAVLLENADGTVGNIRLQQEKGEVLLNQPRQGANIDGLATAPYQVDEARIKKDFGLAMQARPPLPVNFLLYFESGGTRLTAASQELVPRIVEASSNRPVPDITVIGHTDTAGTEAANERLALDRAQFVAGLLKTAGMVAHELSVASHGESNLLVKTADDTAEPRNRRVEVNVR